jgi:hypothetical protein
VFDVKDVASANVRAVCWESVDVSSMARLIFTFFSTCTVLDELRSRIVPDPSLPSCTLQKSVIDNYAALLDNLL